MCLSLRRVDPRTYSFVTKLRIPALRIDGHYSLRGRVLLLPLQGHGTCWFEPRESSARPDVSETLSLQTCHGTQFSKICLI